MQAYCEFDGKRCRCPKCGDSDNMVAVVTIGVQIMRDGDLDPDPEVFVADNDPCVCNGCDYEGTVCDFVASEDYAHIGADDEDRLQACYRGARGEAGPARSAEPQSASCSSALSLGSNVVRFPAK